MFELNPLARTPAIQSTTKWLSKVVGEDANNSGGGLNRLELLALSGHHSLDGGGTFSFKGKGWKKKKPTFKD